MGPKAKRTANARKLTKTIRGRIKNLERLLERAIALDALESWTQQQDDEARDILLELSESGIDFNFTVV